MGNRKESRIKAIGTYKLLLDTRFILDLLNTFFALDIFKNLIYISKLDCDCFKFSLVMDLWTLSEITKLLEIGYLCDGLYILKLNSMYEQSLHTLIMAWTWALKEWPLTRTHLCYGIEGWVIFRKKRMTRLMKDRLPPNLNFTKFYGLCWLHLRTEN